MQTAHKNGVLHSVIKQSGQIKCLSHTAGPTAVFLEQSTLAFPSKMLQKVKTKNAPHCCLAVRMLQLKWQRERCSEYFTQNGHRAFSRKQADNSVGSGTGQLRPLSTGQGQSCSSSVLCAAADQVAASLELNKAGHLRGLCPRQC